MKALANNASKQNNIVSSSGVFGDYLVMLLAPCVVAFWYYGPSVLAVIAVSIATALGCDFVASVLLGRNFKLRDLSNIFIGTAIALMMPAGIPLYIPAVAVSFAVIAVKIPFGGALHAPFVPAAAGFAFASVCFKEQIFNYTVGSEDKIFGANSLASILARGNSVSLNSAATAFDILAGNVAGPMGTGCAILMIACCAYLFVRRRKALLATAGFIAACVVFAMISPRINASVFSSILLELSSGSLLFASVFLITDYATLPRNNINKVIYGAVCGILCMVMRKMGTFEEPVCFAILLANGFRPVLDSVVDALPSVLLKRKEASVK